VIKGFADSPFGDFYCFDYRQSRANPTIVLYDHENDFQEEPEEAIGGIFRVAVIKVVVQSNYHCNTDRWTRFLLTVIHLSKIIEEAARIKKGGEYRCFLNSMT